MAINSFPYSRLLSPVTGVSLEAVPWRVLCSSGKSGVWRGAVYNPAIEPAHVGPRMAQTALVLVLFKYLSPRDKTSGWGKWWWRPGSPQCWFKSSKLWNTVDFDSIRNRCALNLRKVAKKEKWLLHLKCPLPHVATRHELNTLTPFAILENK